MEQERDLEDLTRLPGEDLADYLEHVGHAVKSYHYLGEFVGGILLDAAAELRAEGKITLPPWLYYRALRQEIERLERSTHPRMHPNTD